MVLTFSSSLFEVNLAAPVCNFIYLIIFIHPFILTLNCSFIFSCMNLGHMHLDILKSNPNSCKYLSHGSQTELSEELIHLQSFVLCSADSTSANPTSIEPKSLHINGENQFSETPKP